MLFAMRFGMVFFLLFSASAHASQGASFPLGSGDVLEISVWGDESRVRKVLVRPDGMISFPLVGDMQAAGVSVDELRAGLEMQTLNRKLDEHVLSLLVSRIPVLPFTQSDAESFGVLRAAVRNRSRNALDRLIAAHAVNTGTTLVTNNEADFKDYPRLVIENWALES